MNKRMLLAGFLLTCISIGIAYYSIINQKIFIKENIIGNFLFEKTNKQGIDVDKIIIKAPQLHITLYYQDKFWHIKEADGYLADLVTMNKLFQDISQSKIEALATDVNIAQAGLENPTEQKNPQAGFEIYTYNKRGQLLDAVIIGGKKNNLRYAKNKNTSEIYLISGDFDLSDKLKYWFQQPLISIEPKNIESVIMQSETGQQLAFRMSEQSAFYNLQQKPTNILPLLEKFMLFTFNNAKKIQNTPLESMEPEKVIVLFPYSGLIYGIEIFKIDEDYWVEIDLSITKLPTKIASDYIKDSKFLYKDWAFKIDDNLGKYLINYKIN